MVDRLNRMLRGWADYFREGGEEKREEKGKKRGQA